jgi:hypothetical protein
VTSPDEGQLAPIDDPFEGFRSYTEGGYIPQEFLACTLRASNEIILPASQVRKYGKFLKELFEAHTNVPDQAS